MATTRKCSLKALFGDFAKESSSAGRIPFPTAMKRGLLFVLLLRAACAHFVYKKSLPAGLSFNVDDQRARVLESSDSSMECARRWMNNPPKVFIYDAKTRRCIGHDEVYGMTNATISGEAFLLPIYEEERCSGVSALRELKEILTCRYGWFKITIGNSAACYGLMLHPEYEYKTEPGYACQEAYPLSQAASIHSAEEERAIAKVLAYDGRVTASDARMGSWYGVKIGLLYNEGEGEWKWLDGSAMDYSNLIAQSKIEEYCVDLNHGKRCFHGGLYWVRNNGVSKLRWEGADMNHRPLLCKYKLY